MANLFEGEFKAVGVKESLQSKEGKAGGKGPEISAQFKVQEGEKGTDDRGKEVSVGNKTLTWYATLTENTRDRIEEGLKNFGMKDAWVKAFLDKAEGGQFGSVKNPKCGFGDVVGSLSVEIDEYQGKKKSKVQWLNSADGGSRKRMDEIDLEVEDDDDDDSGSGDAPDWQRE